MSARAQVWFLMLCLCSLAAFAYGRVAVRADASGLLRVWLFLALGSAGMLSVFLFPSFKARSAIAAGIWLPAIVLRLFLLPSAPSDDVNRYLWEGKLVRNGVSPYAWTADDGALEPYRDAYWTAMNHKDKATAYPPLAELGFAAIGALAYHAMAYKIVFVLADLFTLAGILSLLKRRGLALSFSGLYALNPLVLLAYSGEAHFDALLLAHLVWGLWACDRGRHSLSVALISVATGIKWIALPLIPFFTGRRLLSGAVVALAVLLVPALCFGPSLLQLLSGLFEFGGIRNFNGPVYELLLYGTRGARAVSGGLVLLAFASVVLWRWLLRERAAADSHIRWILGALLVLSPTVHFWYLTWILPFVCLRPSLPWLTFALSGGAYFFVWANVASGEGWGLDPWQQGLYWGPFFAACLYELWSTRGRVLMPVTRDVGAGGQTVAVVLPTLNAADVLSQALASIEVQTTAVHEVIVVDADSSDGTLEVARSVSLPIRILSSEAGRGAQIAKGMEASTADWVIVLHADAVLEPDSVRCLLQAAAHNPDCLGGAFGQRFDGDHPGLLPIEVLNDFRALFTRTAFGDQVQFFHRETALCRQLMPRQPLMEDLESSWRLRELGGGLYLGQACRVSHWKWDSKHWLKRFSLVLRLVAKYRWARLHGREKAGRLSERLYLEYYPERK